ncbi:MAG: CPXCG motif-containing cysteine-rich protein [Candidatus Scalindua sp.]|nr:CPXCG motif-containing cysteine-rich protein [Candidatus Scalindua sp.]
MNFLEEHTISCPYCGELITILVDRSVDTQQYIEDCQVCCRPIVIQVIVSANGRCQIDARDENS